MNKKTNSIENKPIGWIDTSDPAGAGYKIMTEYGLKIYDFNEKVEFINEMHRVNRIIEEAETHAVRR